MRRINARRLAFRVGSLAVAGIVAAYVAYPWVARHSATADESARSMPGDSVVAHAQVGYTLAVSIAAPAAEVWPWLVQMGQGRAGFYTHEFIENVLGARIRNADEIVPALQTLTVGDSVRLTPDPYRGRPGQYIVVEALAPKRALVFRQRLPNGALGTWTFVLQPSALGTRLLFRRRGGQPSLFDRIMLPGYYFMDRGMLRGIKHRSERRDA